MQSFLFDFSETHRLLTYLIIFLGMFIEGEMILILAGILVKSGKLDFFDVLFFVFVAVVFHDIVFWWLGKKFSEKGRKKILFLNLEKIIPFLERIKQGNGLYIFASKFTWNLNRFVLMASGYIKLPFQKLLRYTLPAAFVWSITFISLGYFFAHKTHLLRKDLKTAVILITIFLIMIFVLENIFRKIFNRD